MRLAKIRLRETAVDESDFFNGPSRRSWWELEVVDGDLHYTISDDLFYVSRAAALQTCADVARALQVAAVNDDPGQITSAEMRSLFEPVRSGPCSRLSLSELQFGLRPLRARVTATIEQVAHKGGLDARQVKRCESKATFENLNVKTVKKYLAGCGFELQLVPVE